MSDEAGLLRAIRAAPRDLALRRVYADWLEEHGDPLAEHIRAEEAGLGERMWQLWAEHHARWLNPLGLIRVREFRHAGIRLCLWPGDTIETLDDPLRRFDERWE